MRLTARDIARVCHEANRALQTIQADAGIPVADTWDDFHDQQVVIDGVVAVLDGSGSPQMLHEKWCEAKRADGWRYGEVKDVDRKTHPCLVDYSQLPPEQQLKDRLFISIVLALAPKKSNREEFDRGVHGG
jgi:hypothetical protein